MNLSSKIAEKLKVYKSYANDAFRFKYIYNEDDVNNDDNIFKPEYTHQLFGDDETIFGYKDLKVNYYLTPANLDAYIGLKCAEKITPQRFDGIEPDDVYDIIMKFGCSPGFTRNLDLFLSDKLKQDREFKPFGVKIHEYDIKSDDNCTNKYEIYKIDSKNTQYNDKKFVDYITRVQTMLVYYIETASFVDLDDEQWSFYLLYKKSNENYRYTTVGYLSVYKYYAYPNKTRFRISQMLIMPTFQHQGHGARLMRSVYVDSCNCQNVIDITAESPSDEFLQLRDYVTSCMCEKLTSFKDAKQIKDSFNENMYKEALEKYKIPKLQSRRCYEILRLRATNENDADEWAKYRLEIKKRLYQPFLRNLKFARTAGLENDAANESGNHEEEDDDNEEDDDDEEDDDEVSVDNKEKKRRKATPNRYKEGENETENGESSKTVSFKRIRFDPAVNASNSKNCSNSNGNGISASNGFDKPSSSSGDVKTVSFKSVRFSAPQATSSSNGSSSNGKTTIGFGKSTTEDESNADTDDQQLNNSMKQEYKNLFMNESERKEYLEKRFIETVNEYKKIIKRLDNHSNDDY